jgi:hypothetical protein
MVIEPAARFGIIDLNKDNKNETAPYGNLQTGDDGQSGKQTDIGVNFYWAGHSNKTQIEFENWKAESGSAKAEIFRLQHTLAF